MDNLHQTPRSFLSFSDSIEDVPAHDIQTEKRARFQEIQVPSNDDITFQWRIDPSSSDGTLPRDHTRHDTDDSLSRSISPSHRKTLLRSLIWPVSVIVVPIVILSAIFLALVFGYEVETEQSLFGTSTDAELKSRKSHVLVNFSATRLVFLASWLSTLAPLLASFIMLLWSLPTAQTMRMASMGPEFSGLPTPYQLSLVVGLTLASTERLRRYFSYLFSKKHSTIPPVLHQAARMLTLSVILSGAVFVADTALHYTTETISIDKIVTSSQPSYAFGRALAEDCVNFNRSANYGYPCTFPWNLDTPEKILESNIRENEVYYLRHNTSTESEIQFVEDSDLQNGDLGIIIPQHLTSPSNIDYRGTTIGVSTQCYPISQNCNMQANGPYQMHTQFNCTDNFWGLLGKPPNVSEMYEKAQDSAVPPLDWKPSPNLQYGFFADPSLNIPYNTIPYDPKTGSSDTDLPSMPDADLINPVYLAVAGRFSVSSQSAGSNLSDVANETGLWKGPNEYVDFVLNCSYTTYEVEYVRNNGIIEVSSFSPSPNGSLAEVYHGRQSYVSVSGGAYDLLDDITTAAKQNTSDGFAREWANLHSVRVLGELGGYSSPQLNLQEQTRTPLLVAKVPKAALGALIACSLAYVFLGVSLGVAAYRASSTDVRDLAARLSLAGLAAAAFDESDVVSPRAEAEKSTTPTNHVFDEKAPRPENRRVGVEGDAQTGYGFRVWV